MQIANLAEVRDRHSEEISSSLQSNNHVDRVRNLVGNRLVGNPDDAAALELTLVGGSYRFHEASVFAVTGSDFEPRLLPAASVGQGGERLPLWETRRARAGDVLTLGASREGARCYLCVRGGIDVPPILGSRSALPGTKLAPGRARLSSVLRPACTR